MYGASPPPELAGLLNVGVLRTPDGAKILDPVGVDMGVLRLAANGLDLLDSGGAIIGSRCAPPVADTPAGAYVDVQTIALTCATPNATIYYTTDGSAPDESKTKYTAPIGPTGTNQTIKAVAVKAGHLASTVLSNAYTFKCATPVAAPAAGTYTGAQSVVLTTASTAAAIYYTVNGTTPTSGSTLYTGPISVAASKTVKAIAIEGGVPDSAVLTAVYVIN